MAGRLRIWSSRIYRPRGPKMSKQANEKIHGNPLEPRRDGAARGGANGLEQGDMSSGASQGGLNTHVPTREPIVLGPTSPPRDRSAIVVGDMISGDPRGGFSPSLTAPKTSLPPIEPVADSARDIPAPGRQT